MTSYDNVMSDWEQKLLTHNNMRWVPVKKKDQTPAHPILPIQDEVNPQGNKEWPSGCTSKKLDMFSQFRGRKMVSLTNLLIWYFVRPIQSPPSTPSIVIITQPKT